MSISSKHSLSTRNHASAVCNTEPLQFNLKFKFKNLIRIKNFTFTYINLNALSGCWFVGGDILTGALHVLQLQLLPLTASIILGSNKIHNGDIPVPANPGPSGKQHLKRKENVNALHPSPDSTPLSYQIMTIIKNRWWISAINVNAFCFLPTSVSYQIMTTNRIHDEFKPCLLVYRTMIRKINKFDWIEHLLQKDSSGDDFTTIFILRLTTLTNFGIQSYQVVYYEQDSLKPRMAYCS